MGLILGIWIAIIFIIISGIITGVSFIHHHKKGETALAIIIGLYLASSVIGIIITVIYYITY